MMTIRTRLVERLSLSIPVIQAPMAGGGDTAELVAAVSNAGALGSIGAAYLTPQQIVERGRAVRALTPRPFGINLFAPLAQPSVDAGQGARARARLEPYFAELGLEVPEAPTAAVTNFSDQFAACMESGAAVFSFAFGVIPAEAVEEARRRGMLVMGTATNVSEAMMLAQTGVDAVIAQGSEAGGHRSTFGPDVHAGLIGTFALVPQVVDAVPVPVVASGGIMDGRGITAALVLGATAAQMGTAFLTCAEAGVPEAYKQAILTASEDQTRITRAFSGRPARGIANRVLNDFEQNTEAILPFPLQNALTRPLRTAAGKANRAEYLSLWAGQGLRMARRLGAAELVARLEEELAAMFEGMARLRESATIGERRAS